MRTSAAASCSTSTNAPKPSAAPSTAEHDGNGRWYWVENVYLDTLVAYAEHDERWYRIGYTFDESATDPVITFAEESTWERVQSEWMPVADGNGVRSMATLRVRKLPDVMPEDLPAIITRDGHTGYQTRTMSGQVRYLAEEKRTEIILEYGRHRQSPHDRGPGGRRMGDGVSGQVLYRPRHEPRRGALACA